MDTSWALFDRLADRYDEVVPFFARFADQMLDALDLGPGALLLDLGCGRGAIAAAAKDRGCQVTAIDGAPRMIELVKTRYPAVHAQVMDAIELDFPDDTFDVITAGFMIHLVDDPALVLAEVRRVGRAGAMFALTVPGPYAEQDSRWAAYNALVREFQPRAVFARTPGRDIDIPALLDAAGLADVARANIEVHLSVPDPQTCWDFGMSHGFAGFVEALSPADAAELHERAMAEFTEMHTAGGIVLDRGAYLYTARVPGDLP